MIADHTPISPKSCGVCEKFPEGKVPPSGTVVCAKVDPADGAVHCFSRNADYRGDDGGALTWWGCRSDMPPCRIPFTQTEVLTALYESTGGKTWEDKENWLGGGEPCDPEKQWDRVTCDDDGDVTTLELPENRLSGGLPSELGDLTTLTELKIYDTSLSGTLPSELGELSALTILALVNNQVSGSLPSELSDLAALDYLYLRSNSLSGTLPSALGELTALTVLSIVNNQVSGSVPSQLGELIALEYLGLNGNSLSGTLPSELSKLTADTITFGCNLGPQAGDGLTGWNSLSGPCSDGLLEPP